MGDFTSYFFDLLGYLYIIPAIFEFVVSSTAKQRHPGSATQQMFAGSLIGLLVSLTYLGSNIFSTLTGNFELYEIGYLYALLNFLGLFSQILFLIGLNSFIKNYRSRDESSLLDRY